MIRAKLFCMFLMLACAVQLNAAAKCGPQFDGKAQSGPVASAIIGLANPTSFTISDRGATSYSTNGTAGTVAAGYARVQANAGSTTPAGYLIFGFTQGGVLVSEAAVPETRPVSSGRIYANVEGSVNTGLAIANPNSTAALISFFFTDESGASSGSGSFTLDANSQIARFLNEPPFNGAGTIRGTLTFSSTVPVGVVALRGFTNERHEFLMTTLPVAAVGTTSSEVVFMPHYADGGGWITKLVLVNPTDAVISGMVSFIGTGGSTMPYTIAPRASQNITTSGAGVAINVGAIRVTPNAGSPAPAGLSIFSFINGGVRVSEAGVPALRPAQSFRMYEIECGTYPGQINTGIAIANPSTTASATVLVEQNDLNGVPTGRSTTLVIPPLGGVAKFVNQLAGFETTPWPFHGVLRISTTSAGGIAVIGLRGQYNTRSDFLVTTAMPSDESVAPSAAEAIFPHLVDGGGYNSEFILYSGSSGQISSGMLRFFNQAGAALN